MGHFDGNTHIYRARAVGYYDNRSIRESDATRDLLSAKTFEDIIELSGGLYAPPDQCRMRQRILPVLVVVTLL